MGTNCHPPFNRVIFNTKYKRGEWFELSENDIKTIKEYIEKYEA